MNHAAPPSDGSTMASQAKLLKQLSVEVGPLTPSDSHGLRLLLGDPSHGQQRWSLGNGMAIPGFAWVIMC